MYLCVFKEYIRRGPFMRNYIGLCLIIRHLNRVIVIGRATFDITAAAYKQTRAFVHTPFLQFAAGVDHIRF